MPTSFFTNAGRISPKTKLKNNAQARSSTLSQYSDDTSIYNSTFVTRNPKNHPSNFLAITPEPAHSQASEKGTWLGNFSGGILDVDVESSIISTSSVDQDDDAAQQDSEQDDDMHTMSGLGPSLRFHSRAPWELEEDDIDEEDEADYGVLLASNAISRPSVESYRSQTNSKKSFETTSSQVHPRGALYALAQESLSTSSLGSSLGQAPSLTTASLARVRSESAGTTSSMTLGVQSSNSIPSNALSPHATTGTRAYNSRKHSKPESSHPYANPAFALSHESTSSMHETPASVFRTDSRTTVTESIASQAASTSKLDAIPSFTSFNFRRKQSAPSIHGKEISSPLAVSNSAIHVDDVASLSDNHQPLTSSKSGHLDHIPGWTDRGVPPPFNLISLEEARAQRTRAGTQSSDPQLHTPLPDSIPFPTRRPTADTYDPGMEAQRVRSVSTSGGKAGLASSSNPVKQDQEPADAGSSDPSPPPGKTVKQRKSGFLRLFSGRTAEKEDKTPVPPLPPLTTDINTSLPPKKHMLPRSPVHEFSPTMLISSSEDFTVSPTESRRHIWDQSPSPKRATPANLSINTRSPMDGKGRSSTMPERKVNTDVATSPVSPQDAPKKPWLDSSYPQSAPPNITEFPPLRLRPVSAFFSSQFEGLLDAEVPQVPPLEEPTTPASTIPSNFTTPITPVSYTGRPEMPRKAVREVDHSPKSSLAGTESVSSSERAWQQQHIRDLEYQVLNLQAELAELRAGHYCTACGRGGGSEHDHADHSQGQKHSVVHRPRAPTGNISRFVNNLT